LTKLAFDYVDNYTKPILQTLTAKSSIEYDLKVGGLPLKGTCVACGADCTFTIPVIKVPVSKGS
jgi:hypothetical protein